MLASRKFDATAVLFAVRNLHAGKQLGSPDLHRWDWAKIKKLADHYPEADPLVHKTLATGASAGATPC